VPNGEVSQPVELGFLGGANDMASVDVRLRAEHYEPTSVFRTGACCARRLSLSIEKWTKPVAHVQKSLGPIFLTKVRSATGADNARHATL
jgi:hypothetical protein